MTVPESLKTITAQPARADVIEDCKLLIDKTVKSQSGIKGVAIKSAYGAIKAIKRGFVQNVVDALLDDWVDKLEPYYSGWHANRVGSLGEFLHGQADEVAEALLEVTDARAQDTKHGTAKKYYVKHRPKAKEQVAAAIPDLGALLEKHLTQVQAGAA